MELKRENNKEYPKEQHGEPEKGEGARKKVQPQQKKIVQRLHLFEPHNIHAPNWRKELDESMERMKK